MPFSFKQAIGGVPTKRFGIVLHEFEQIDSTNTYLKSLADGNAPEGTVVTAEYQTSGRGRSGRSWYSTSGANLLSSFLLRPRLPAARHGLLTFYAAVAAAKAIETVTGCAIECKWPNDLLLNGKKCCGILVESSFQQSLLQYAVIGCGINVNQRQFDGEYIYPPTSLANELGRSIDRAELLTDLLLAYDELYDDAVKDNFSYILDSWRSRCRFFGGMITVVRDNEMFEAQALDIEPDGGLRISTASGTEVVYQADVKLRPHS